MKKKWPYLIYFAFGFLAITWFNGHQYISIGDFAFPMDGGLFSSNIRHVWDSDIGIGRMDTRQLAFLLPYSLLAGGFHALGLGMDVFERVLFYVWFAGSGISAHLLCRQCGASRQGAFAGGFFYMTSFYALSIAWHLASGLILPAYAFFPLILALFMWVFDSGFRPVDTALLLVVWFLVCGSYMYANPAFLVVHWLPLGLYAVFGAWGRDRAFVIRRGLGFLATMSLFLLVNAHFIVPFVADIGGQVAQSGHQQYGFISEIKTLLLNSAPLQEQLAGRGIWDVLGEYRGTPFHDWGESFSGSLNIAFGYLIIGLAAVPLFRKDSRKESRYFWILLVAGFFLSKGLLPPFGFVLEYVYKLVPALLGAFRGTVQKWGMLIPLAVAPLLALSVDRIRPAAGEAGTRLRHALLVLLGLGYVFLCALPFITGEVIASGGPLLPGARFDVPDDYLRLRAAQSRSRQSGRTLSLPLTRNGNVAYVWSQENGSVSSYTGGDFIRWFTDHPVLFLTRTEVEHGIEEVLRSRPGGVQARPEVLLGMENISHVLMHKDWSWSFWEGHPWQYGLDKDALNDFMHRLGAGEPVFEGEHLALYRVPGTAFMPRVYAPREIVVDMRRDTEARGLTIPQLLGALERQPLGVVILDSPGILPRPMNVALEAGAMEGGGTAIIVDNGTRGRAVNIERPHGPTLEYRQLSPVRWLVRGHGVNDDFPLFFGEGYDRGWRVFLRPVPEGNQTRELLDAYRVLEGNEADQATAGELASYLDRGWVSDLGGKPRQWRYLDFDSGRKRLERSEQTVVVDYVSKVNACAIQNDNLAYMPDGGAGRLLPLRYHGRANGQANLWWVPLDAVQSAVGAQSGVPGPDAGYDVEMVIEFVPQRTYEAMLWVSGGTAALLVLVLLVGLVRRR